MNEARHDAAGELTQLLRSVFEDVPREQWPDTRLEVLTHAGQRFEGAVERIAGDLVLLRAKAGPAQELRGWWIQADAIAAVSRT